MSVPLFAEGRVTLDATGAGVVLLSVPWPQVWRITRMSTQLQGTPGTATGAQLRVFRGLTGTVLGTSAYAISDTSDDPNGTVLNPGEILRAEYTAGGSGQVFRFSVEGERLDLT